MDIDDQPLPATGSTPPLPPLNLEGGGDASQSPNVDLGPEIDMDDGQPVNSAPTELYDPESTAHFRNASASAREGVWSNGHRVTVEDDEEDLDAAMYMDADLGIEEEDLDGDGGFWGDEDQYYDEYEELYGLPAGDLIDEEMEQQLAQFAEELTEDDLAILRAFALKTEDHLTNATHKRLVGRFAASQPLL
ncbi:hypothetical protein B0H14DRAFT_3491445 [Mycena olivaceomarginata]|nr:hypothetical protein B0H14DRAFT_3491445 [Mycena olivaceomarginata]